MRRPKPIDKENFFPDDKIIVSKTDTKGKITYCNEIFMEMAKYSEEELLGKPHSIIRHPDMPKAVFKLLWDTIQQGQEINAYVKNLSKDGSYYWVFANVTPSFDNNKNIVGYFSVRRKPKKDTINNTIIPLYKKLLDIEKTEGMDASVRYLLDLIKQKGTTYEEFILSI